MDEIEKHGFYSWIFQLLREYGLEGHSEGFSEKKLDDNQKFEILDLLLNCEKLQNMNIKQDIAAIALDLYVRNECRKDVKDEENFIEWAKKCVTEKLFLSKNVDKVLNMYGWFSVVGQTEESSISAFDGAMERGDLDLAASILDFLPKDEFETCALRLFDLKREATVEAMFRKGYLDTPKLIPLLMSKEAIPYIPQMITSHTLLHSWQRNAVAIQLTKIEDKQLQLKLAKKFIELVHIHVSDYDFALRVWTSTGNKEIVAEAMASTGNLTGVVLACPEKSIEVIQGREDIEDKRQAALKLLKSLDRKDAEATAQKLLDEDIGESIGVDILLTYLPDNIKVKTLIDPFDVFLTDLQEKQESDKKNKDSASKGIEAAHLKLKRFPDEHGSVSIDSSETCCLCQNNVIGEKCIVFNCEHCAHTECLIKHYKRIGMEPEENDVKSSCPICGLISCMSIDLPYDNFEYREKSEDDKKEEIADKWSVEPSDLKKLTESGNSHSILDFKFFE